MTLKVLLASAEGENFFHLLDDVDGIEISRCPGSEVTKHAADIDILFGHPAVDLLYHPHQHAWRAWTIDWRARDGPAAGDDEAYP